MDNNISDKLQQLNNTFCELKLHKADDEEYIPIVRDVEEILKKEPDNIAALQLKILIKTSYKIIQWSEVDAICHHLLKLEPRNKIAKRALKRKTYNYKQKKSIEPDFSLIFILIIAIICTIYLYKNWVSFFK